MINIEQITPQLTWQLRRVVLYPDNMLWEMEMEEDNHGYHFGVFIDNQLIGVVSLFQQQNVWQFRKFAIDPAYQSKGIGRQLLQYIIKFARDEGGTRLWCNARLSAIGFYLKSGFTETDEYFSKNGFDYEILEVDL